MHDYKKMAHKGMSGDKEAIELLIILSPSGHMGAMSGEQYAKKVYENDTFRKEMGGKEEGEGEEMSEDEYYKDKIAAFEEVLAPFFTDDEDQMEAATAVCEAIAAGDIPGVMCEMKEENPGEEY